MSAEAPQSVLIIRLSAIGDVVMATPLVGCVREAYPDAQISWLVQPAAAQLLEPHPELDEVIVWPNRAWGRALRRGKLVWLFRELRKLRRRLRERNFELAIDAHGLMKSGVWAWLSGARRRVGLGSHEGSQWLMHEVVERQIDHPLIGGQYKVLAQHVGLPVENFAPRLELTEDSRAAADKVATAAGGAYAVLIPCTTRPQKHWFEERWSEVAARVDSELGLRPVILGGPGDAAMAATIAKGNDRILDLTGERSLSLIDSVATIDRAALVIGVDTGMIHMASVRKVPTIALWGSTIPYTDALSERTRTIVHPMECQPCRHHPTCGGEFTCMRRITVDEVLATARGLLGGS